MKNMRLRFIVLFFLFSASSAFTQSDISGKWNGTYTWLNKNYPQNLQLEQQGDKITGVVTSYRKDSAEHASYEVEGFLKNDKYYLLGTKFVSSKGVWCLPRLELTLVEVNGQMLLEGKWKPNIKLGGCLAGSGRVSTVKEMTITTQVASASSVDTPSTDHSDAFTQGMIKGLREREYYALVFGVNEYQDDDMPDLDNPIQDGQRLLSVLSKHYDFKPEHVTFMGNPTRSQILDAMQNLGEQLSEKDNVLIFYAGHGIWDEQLAQGYWLPSDAARDSKANWISNSTIRDYIRSINTQHTLLISDACFSGGLLKERSVGKAMMNLYKMPSRKAITSGTLTTVPDKSVFLDYMIKYLEENDRPMISADELFYRTKISVINNSPSYQVPQYGPIHQANDEGGEFVFLRKQ